MLRHLLLAVLLHLPGVDLFPYTTLFRSVRSTVIVRVPASSANLGPGFDTLGMALSLHAEAGVIDNAIPRVSKPRSEEHTSELQSLRQLACRLTHETKTVDSERTNQVPVQ